MLAGMTIHHTPRPAAISTAALAASLLLGLAPASAQPTAPRSAPSFTAPARGVPDATDTPYPGGTLTLDIDATDTPRGVWHVAETVPVAPGTRELILQLPQWIPGDHEPSGRVDQIADLHFTSQGQPLAWWRDPLEGFAFHIALPAGTQAVDARFVHTSPLTGAEGQITMTAEMLNLEWSHMSLYPAGHYVRQIRVKPSVTLPAGWGYASALDGAGQSGGKLSWAATDYETLIDSPLFAGAHFKRVELGHNVALNVVADKAEDLAFAKEAVPAYKALVEEALLAFGSHHFDHYDWLLGLTDRMGGVGLEHHRSSENTMTPKALADWAEKDWDRNVLAHEFSHSWDGKFRRPTDLWTPDYRTPMQDSLLWVYEGQTQFWGNVLAARSGVQSKAMVLGIIASDAGQFAEKPGRAWRSVADTTNDPIIGERRPEPYESLERQEDYYEEGALVWLEADQIIRAGTGGQKGLDNFAKGFFGVKDGDWGELPYRLDDVVAALNAVYPYDWGGFLQAHIAGTGQPAPLGGIEKGGYRLVWKDTPNPYEKARMDDRKLLDLTHSLGISVGEDGQVKACQWGSAAFNAGVVTGAKILAVNGEAYDKDDLKAAITAAKSGGAGGDKPITLVVQRGDHVETLSIAYHDGLRWPWLEKVGLEKVGLEKAGAGQGLTGLDALLAPRRAGAK